MAYEVLLTEDAEKDLEELYDYLSVHDSPAKANHVLEKIDDTLSRLSNLSDRGAYPKELLALGIHEYREVFFKPYLSLAQVIRKPSTLPLNEYEQKLGDFLRNFCHRDTESGWKHDKRLRDTGPFTASLQGEEWVGAYHGTHAPVVIWLFGGDVRVVEEEPAAGREPGHGRAREDTGWGGDREGDVSGPGGTLRAGGYVEAVADQRCGCDGAGQSGLP